MLQRYPPWAPPIAAGPGGDAAEALPRPPPAPVGMLQRYPPWAPPIAAGTGGDVAEVPALGTADRRRHRWGCCRGTRPGHRRSPPAPVGTLRRPCPGRRRHRWGCCRGTRPGHRRSPPAPVEMLQRYPPWAPPIAAGTGGDVAEVPALGTADRRRPRWGRCGGPAPAAAGPGGDAAEALPRPLPAPVGTLRRPCPG